MTWIDYVIIAVLAVAVLGIIAYLVKEKRKGKSGCGCGCGGCCGRRVCRDLNGGGRLVSSAQNVLDDVAEDLERES